MMNPKKMHKSIIGVAFLFLVVGFLGFHYVNAVEEITYCDNQSKKPDSSEVIQRYGFNIEHISGNTFKVTMSSGCGEDVAFKISSINNRTSDTLVGQSVSCDAPLTFTLNSGDVVPEPYTGLDGIIVKLKSDGPVKAYTQVADSCYWTGVEAEMSMTVGGSETTTPVDFDDPPTAGVTIKSTVIDCDNYTYKIGNEVKPIVRGSGSFEEKFCIAKTKAIAAGNKYDFGSGRYTGDAKTFKCETDFINHPELVPTNPEEMLREENGKKKEDYFVNKQYLYGEATMKDEEVLYYHYSPQYEDKSRKLTCTITCKEAVEVEYGPPVASVAGVCFEYIVRVTSRVSCNMTEKPDKSNMCEKSYCTPYPRCVHNGGSVYTQGGPSEEFDACVNACDGGKYSKSCSNSCYKEVYGTSTAYAKVNSVYFDDLFASKVYNGTSYKCDGYYTKDGKDGSIKWVGTGPNNPAGRWYCDHKSSWHPVHNKSTYITDSSGFFRGNYGRCSDSCSWQGCGGKVYVNREVTCGTLRNNNKYTANMSDEDFQKYCNGRNDTKIDVLKYDCDKNTEAYEKLVARCEAKAMCSTEVAEFTISVDYTKQGSTTVTKLEFPYDGQKDRVANKGGGLVATTQDQHNTTLRPDFPNNDGMKSCYLTNGERPDEYRSTWSFPGSWMNIKTGEISYNPDGKDRTVWYEHPKRFCIPGDAKGVNVLWYNSFMNRKLKEINIETSSDDSYIEGICKYNRKTHSITKFSEPIPENELKFNITASTRNFGYFGWNIDIKCLYALNENPVCGNYANDECTDDEEVITKCTPESEYRVHTVDNSDMFPNEDGAELRDPSQASRSYVGYNWSKYAINDKNPDYKSNPPAYLAKIQANANSMYTDANLDYEFYLSPKTIRTLRSQTTGSNANYTAFSDSGFHLDSNGISRYESSKIRDASIFDSSNSKVPGKGTVAISCNNMISWNNTGACDRVHG